MASLYLRRSSRRYVSWTRRCVCKKPRAVQQHEAGNERRITVGESGLKAGSLYSHWHREPHSSKHKYMSIQYVRDNTGMSNRCTGLFPRFNPHAPLRYGPRLVMVPWPWAERLSK